MKPFGNYEVPSSHQSWNNNTRKRKNHYITYYNRIVVRRLPNLESEMDIETQEI